MSYAALGLVGPPTETLAGQRNALLRERCAQLGIAPGTDCANQVGTPLVKMCEKKANVEERLQCQINELETQLRGGAVTQAKSMVTYGIVGAVVIVGAALYFTRKKG